MLNQICNTDWTVFWWNTSDKMCSCRGLRLQTPSTSDLDEFIQSLDSFTRSFTCWRKETEPEVKKKQKTSFSVYVTVYWAGCSCVRTFLLYSVELADGTAAALIRRASALFAFLFAAYVWSPAGPYCKCVINLGLGERRPICCSRLTVTLAARPEEGERFMTCSSEAKVQPPGSTGSLKAAPERAPIRKWPVTL